MCFLLPSYKKSSGYYSLDIWHQVYDAHSPKNWKVNFSVHTISIVITTCTQLCGRTSLVAHSRRTQSMSEEVVSYNENFLYINKYMEILLVKAMVMLQNQKWIQTNSKRIMNEKINVSLTRKTDWFVGLQKIIYWSNNLHLMKGHWLHQNCLYINITYCKKNLL